VAGRRIEARVVVASPNSVTSPLTGLRGVFFDWTLFVRTGVEGRFGSTREPGEHYDEVGRTGYGQDFFVETTDAGRCGRIFLEASAVRYRVANTGNFGPMLQRAPPAELQHLLPREPVGPIHVRELPLTKGDIVVLRAVVVPHAPHEPEGPLRSQGTVNLEEHVPGRSRLRRVLEALLGLQR
jgi:hypothetical protein